MGLFGWIFYLFLGIGYFFVINFLERKYNISKIEKIIVLLILLIFFSGICFRFAINYTDNIFLSFVFLMIIDVLYSSYFTTNDFFDKNEKNIEFYTILVIIGFIINQEFINNVTEVFLTGEELRVVLWFLSFIFIYKFISDRKVFNNSITKNKFMSEENVLINYVKLKRKFYDCVCSDNKELVNVIYAIMVYENSQRSLLLRNYDYFMFRLNGNKRKLGIMQVESSKFISDSESIDLVFKKLEKLYNKDSKSKTKTVNKAYNVIEKYTDDSECVKYIFDIISKF